MRTRVTLNHNLFRQVVEALDTDPAAVLRCGAGINRLRDATTLLPHTLEHGQSPEGGEPYLLIVAGVDRASLAASIRRALARVTGKPPLAVLSFGLGEQLGAVSGVFREDDSYVALDEVTLADPGLPAARLTPASGVSEETGSETSATEETWSRSIGALGISTWRRLTDLHFGVVGCGRSGMEMATSLARLGVSHITLIDGDRLEAGNLGEIFPGVSEENIGQLKAEVLAALLSSQTPTRLSGVTTVAEPITSQPALIAAKNTDILISCVDHPMGRAATAFLAKLYLQPVLDIGTGIHRDVPPQEGQRIGADIRLVLPGQCLLCFGGIRRIEVVLETLSNAVRGQARVPLQTDWRTERAGSLRSLNCAAVALGIRLLEELIQARLRDSTWLQLNYDAEGIPHLLSVHPVPPRMCSMCRFSGRGDDGLGLFADAVGLNERRRQPL